MNKEFYLFGRRANETQRKFLGINKKISVLENAYYNQDGKRCLRISIYSNGTIESCKEYWDKNFEDWAVRYNNIITGMNKELLESLFYWLDNG